MNYMKDYFKILSGYKKNSLIAILLGFLSSIFEIVGLFSLIPFVFNDKSSTSNSYMLSFMNNLSTQNIVIIILVLLLLKFFFFIYFNYYVENFINSVRNDYIKLISNNYLKLPYNKFIEKSKGYYINNIWTETANLQIGVVSFFELINSILLFLLYAISLFMVDFKITVVLIVINIAVFWLFLGQIKNYLYKINNNKIESSQKILSKLGEAFSAIKLIKLYSFIPKVVDSLSVDLNIVKKVNIFSKITNILPKVIAEVIIWVFVLYYIGFYSDGKILSDSMLYIVALTRLSLSITTITSIKSKIYTMQPSIKICLDGSIIKDNNLKENDLSKNIMNENKLEISNLSFQISEKLVLSDINYSFLENNIYAITGKSGSGKTTLSDLLVKLLCPTKGNIKYNNIDIQTINTLSYRNNISYIMQDNILFDDTLFNNLETNTKLDINNVNYLLERFELNQIFQGDINYILYEGGTNLSGGQRQRLNIIRGLLRKNSNIFIFDEPTNNLHADMVTIVIDEIIKLKHNKIVIIITHDERLINKVDKVLEL